ncbi:MAG: prepilin-type N-terminal cleavage/methylation domain-containing protein [Lachnospiraceae bacterium]|nr:prepilin-type N-terminal cleavage/methylation domain-containing protein [Lachnospiraceae bacterium]
MKTWLHTKKHNCGNSGYTLVELLVSMTLTAIFATAVIAVMPSATKIYMQIQDMSRAQVVADMVVDSLREECADSYIDDFASVRIIDIAPAEGDQVLLDAFNNNPLRFDNTGNVLVVRKSAGYCETIYSDLTISGTNYLSVHEDDRINGTLREENGISSRAVYRLFPKVNGSATPSEETHQGYVHFGYYMCGKEPKPVATSGGTKTVSCIFPASRYDYTNPFTTDAYNGYTVKLSFSDLKYTVTSDSTEDNDYTRRPATVCVTVNVYRSDYNGQSDDTLLYSRTALLVFAEDTTK